jgi:hypothetical protein
MSTPSDEAGFEAKREQMALRYEYVLRHLYGKSRRIGDKIQHWMNDLESRGGAEGYAEADLWRSLNQYDKITDLDVGFVIALEKISHILAYLESRIEHLESKDI